MNKSSLRKIAAYVVLFLLLPVVVYFGARMGGRTYYLVSVAVIALTSLPFFLRFERRRPQARELVILSVLCALAVASRLAFAFAPNFKPLMGIVMVAGMAYGAEAGFLVGALSAFASNFFFGQGPWTPWQMFAYGVGGFLMGILFRKKSAQEKKIRVAASGFLIIFCLVGPLLDTSSLLTMVAAITPQAAATIYLYGLPINFTHALSTFLTLFLIGDPLLQKLTRINLKYGLTDSPF